MAYPRIGEAFRMKFEDGTYAAARRVSCADAECQTPGRCGALHVKGIGEPPAILAEEVG